MTYLTRRLLPSAALMLASALAAAPTASAQARPTADRPTRLSVFAGISGTYVGMYDGRNAGVTAGLDLELFHFFGFQPALELRGTYPVSDGSVVALKNGMGGIRMEKHYGRLHPYGDFLYGRGELNYQDGGLLSKDGSTIYLQSLSNIYSPGAGVDIDLTTHFGLKADAQFQHYNSPITTTGSEWATVATGAIVYHFGLRGYRGER